MIATITPECGASAFALSFGVGRRCRYIHTFLQLLLDLPLSFGAEAIEVHIQTVVLSALALSFGAGLRYRYVHPCLKVCLDFATHGSGVEVIYASTRQMHGKRLLSLLELGFGIDVCIHV